jgi:transcriptional regulator with XRE-family HTH domain
LRGDSKLSQYEAAKMLGAKPEQLAAWEGGIDELPAAMIAKMATLYGVPADVIVDLGTKLPEPEGATEDRIRLILADIEDAMEEDRRNFFIKFPYPIVLVILYALICLLSSLVFQKQLWVPLAYTFISIPVWYVFVAIQLIQNRKRDKEELAAERAKQDKE